MEDSALYQAIAIVAFGVGCFGLGYAVRAVISLHRRTQAMADRVVSLSEQSSRITPRESAKQRPQAEETQARVSLDI